MTSIDDLFKASSNSHKRKRDVNLDANAAYKATKLDGSSSAKPNGHAAVSEDAEEEDDVAGPAMPDEDEIGDDDEDGRFFGGGVNSNTADALDYIEKREGDDDTSEKIDNSWLRKMALNLEKKINKNAELRAKFEQEPEKFMSSEADLDADIKAMSILSQHPDLYPEFAKLGSVASLVSLLSHDNADIAIDAIEIINELTDEDVNATQEQWDAAVDAMLEADLLNLLHENLQRMNEDNEADRSGVYYILNILENLSSRPAFMKGIGKEVNVIKWLLSRTQAEERSVTQNKQYAAEVLNILLQTSPENRTIYISMDGIDKFLLQLSAYQRKDPAKGTEEEELMENLFDSLTCCVDDVEGKRKFQEAEGVELCLIMLREGKASRQPALRLLDHALGGPDDASCCGTLVESAGLKTIFGMYKKRQDKAVVEHLLGIIASLLRSLQPESAPRIRLLSKFEEHDWKVINALSQTRYEVASSINSVDKAIENEKRGMSSGEQTDMADEWLSRRLDAGLYTLRTVDLILAWLVAENKKAKDVVVASLAERDQSLDSVKRTLQEQLHSMNDDPSDSDLDGRDMFATLIEFL